jgi:tetratricopeptide (TPR) repeat protein
MKILFNRFHFNVTLFAGALLLCVSLGAGAGEIEDANKLFKQGHPNQALEKVDGYLGNHPKTDPQNAQARFLKGLILTQQAKTAEAIKVFSALTEDYPELPEPYNNLAVLYAGQGQYEKARQELEMAIRTHPSYATAHENLGDIYAKMASQAYDRALKLDSSNTATQTKLAMIQELFAAGSQKAKETPARHATAPAKAEAATPMAAVAPVAVAAGSKASAVPAQAEPALSHPVADKDESKNIQDTLTAWAAAWSAKDVAGYLSFYADDFKTPSGETRAAWEAARKERLTTPKFIQVEVRILTIKLIDDSHASVKFHQSYRSSQLKSSNTKTMLLVKSGSRWLIQEDLSK